jgi:hypothetical protein
MRETRAALTAVLSLVLLGAVSITVGAEEMPDPMAPAFFTFDEPVALSPEEEAEDGHSDEFAAEMRGEVGVDHMEATDLRASGILTSVTNWNQVLVGRGGLAAGTTRLRLSNDGGTWSGTGQGFHMITERGGATYMAVLIGEGGYEGLTLAMVEYADDDTQTRRGVIFPSDQMPPVPDLEELPVE